MKIKNLRIQNYKSIKDVTIPFQEYGKSKNKSGVAFLVGMNESGKSSILEAINLFQEGFSKQDFEEIIFKGAEENENISITAEIDLDGDDFYKKRVAALIGLDDKFATQLRFEKLSKTISQNATSHDAFYSVTINDNLPFHFYVITGTTEKKIENLKSFNKIEEQINTKNAKDFLAEDQVLLSKEELESMIANRLKKDL